MAEYLDLAEVAARLLVSRRTVERLVAAKRLRVVRPSPGRVAVEVRELEAYQASLRRSVVA